MTPPIHSLVVSPRPGRDPRARGLLGDAHALGLGGLRGIECHDLYFVAGALSEADCERLRTELLSDPVTQTAAWRPARAPKAGGPVIEVALRPGVTDPVAEQVVRAARMLGIAGVERAATGVHAAVDLDRCRDGLAARGDEAGEQLVELVADHADVREADVGRTTHVRLAAWRAEGEQLDTRPVAVERQVHDLDVHLGLADDRLEVAAPLLLVHDLAHAEGVAPERQRARHLRDGQAGVLEVPQNVTVRPPSTTSVAPVT